MLEPFLPEFGVALPAILFSTCRFENQRWIRARAWGLQGSSVAFGLFVDYTGLISAIFALFFIVAYGYDTGWRPVIGLLVISGFVGILWSMIVRDRYIVWIVCTLALWPLGLWMATLVSWFNLV
jgi:hypothetical protein